ncbi:MAG: CHRD domain-containing protein [Balneolaceae bacterium]|nr:CHRD domain-containing protein [Balneolaceae bacterium]
MKIYKILTYIMLLGLLMITTQAFAQESRTIILGGHNSVPKVTTPATATITVTLKKDSLMVEGSFSDLKNYYYGAAIFYGKKGERGNQMFRLDADVAENHVSGTFSPSKNTFKLTEGQLQELANGHLYISIYSYDHKHGEIRAQIPPIKRPGD